MSAPWKFDTLEKLREAGYEYVERGKCLAPSCREQIYWFLTPNKKWMPMELWVTAEGERYQPHFATCPESRKFSRRGEPGKTSAVER